MAIAGGLSVMLLNVVVRGWHCSDWIPNGDEPFSLYFSQWSWKGISEVLMQGNNPPTFEWLVRFFQETLHLDWQSLRWTSVLGASLGAAFLWAASSKHSTRVGLLTASLFLASTHVMKASHLIRAYALEIGLVSGLLWLTIHLSRQRHIPAASNAWRWGLWIALILAIPWVHFYGWLLVVPAFIWVLRAQKWIPAILAMVGLLPLGIHTSHRFLATMESGAALESNRGLGTLLDVFVHLNGNGLVAGLTLAVVLAAIAQTSTEKLKRDGVWLLPLALYAGGSLLTPMHAPRYIALFVPYWCHFMGTSFHVLLTEGSLKDRKLRGSVSWAFALFYLFLATVTSQVRPKTEVYGPMNAASEEVAKHPSATFVVSPRYCDLPFAGILRPHVFHRGLAHEAMWMDAPTSSPKDPLHLELLDSGVQVWDVSQPDAVLLPQVLTTDTLCLCDCGLWQHPKANILEVILDEFPNEVSHFQDLSIHIRCFTRTTNQPRNTDNFAETLVAIDR
ncbi:MAG: hypothetical protein O2791_01920 [Bacteroidetes bacterium]|nr:hypothetical protein [Bacteroidota bacterium]